MNAEAADTRPTDADFARLAQRRKPGEPITEQEVAAAKRVVDAYWPKFGAPRRLPEQWQ